MSSVCWSGQNLSNKITIIYIFYLLVSILCLSYTLSVVDLFLINCMSCFQIDLKENSPIHRILPKTMARQDNSKATQQQDNGKARQDKTRTMARQDNSKARQWQDNGKARQRQVKTTARHLESPEAISKRSCQCKFLDLIFICYSSFLYTYR